MTNVIRRYDIAHFFQIGQKRTIRIPELTERETADGTAESTRRMYEHTGIVGKKSG